MRTLSVPLAMDTNVRANFVRFRGTNNAEPNELADALLLLREGELSLSTAPSEHSQQVDMETKRRNATVTMVVVWAFALIEAAAIGLVLWHR